VALRRETNSIGHRAIAVIGQRQQGRPTPASSVFSNALRFIKQFGATSFSTDGVKKCERGERFPNQYVPVRCKPSAQAEYRLSVELLLNSLFVKQRVRSVTTRSLAAACESVVTSFCSSDPALLKLAAMLHA
jgi:hypothetical protein